MSAMKKFAISCPEEDGKFFWRAKNITSGDVLECSHPAPLLRKIMAESDRPWTIERVTRAPAHDQCPDGGACHHECYGAHCFRVSACAPLSGVYENDEWPVWIEKAIG